MQKIMTHSEKDLKKGRNQLIIGVVLIGLMIFSTLGFAFGNKDDDNGERVEYKGVEFVKGNNGYWAFNNGDYDFLTFYNPQETENISFSSDVSLQDYSNKPLYFSVDNGSLEDYNANYELKRNLYNYAQRIQDTCLSEEDCPGDLPVKNCSEDNVIVFKKLDELNLEEKEGITQEENCVFITAYAKNQERYADAYLFKLLGLS